MGICFMYVPGVICVRCAVVKGLPGGVSSRAFSWSMIRKAGFTSQTMISQSLMK